MIYFFKVGTGKCQPQEMDLLCSDDCRRQIVARVVVEKKLKYMQYSLSF